MELLQGRVAEERDKYQQTTQSPSASAQVSKTSVNIPQDGELWKTIPNPRSAVWSNMLVKSWWLAIASMVYKKEEAGVYF